MAWPLCATASQPWQHRGVPDQSPVPAGLGCPELLCVCWKCLKLRGLHPVRRQSHNCCLKRKALSSSPTDASPDEQALGNEEPGRAQSVPSLCPCSPCPAKPLEISALTYCSSSFSLLWLYGINPAPEEGPPVWQSLSHQSHPSLMFLNHASKVLVLCRAAGYCGPPGKTL